MSPISKTGRGIPSALNLPILAAVNETEPKHGKRFHHAYKINVGEFPVVLSRIFTRLLSRISPFCKFLHQPVHGR